MDKPAIYAEGLVKRFGTFRLALAGVDLAVARRHGARLARTQRERADHRRAHPHDDPPTRRWSSRGARLRRVQAPAGGAHPHRLAGQVRRRRREPHGPREPHHGRPPRPSASRWHRAARRGASRPIRALQKRVDRHVKTYSGGMRLAPRPRRCTRAPPAPCLILDEPTTGLRSSRPSGPLGGHRGARRGWRDVAAHHAVPTTEADRLADRIAVVDHAS